MRKLLIILALISFPVISQAAYLGAGTGTATLDSDTTGADRVDDEDGYFKVIGGIEINQSLNAEFGYIDLGEYMVHFPAFNETDTASATAFTVAGLAHGDLNQSLSAFFRFGISFWTAEVDAVIDDPFFGFFSGSGDGSGNNPFLGAGLDLRFSEKAAIRFEYEKYKEIGEGVAVTADGLGSIELEGGDIDLFGVALVFKLE